MPRYNDDDDNDDAYEARRDAFLTGDSDIPMTRKQRQERNDERDHRLYDRWWWQ